MTAVLAAVAAPAATSSVARKKKPVALILGRYSVGVAYPASVVSAGAQTAWDLREQTGYRSLTKTVSANSGELAGLGWTFNATRIQSTADGATLEGWDTEGLYINLVHNNCIVRDCKVTANSTTTGGINISQGQTISGNLIEYCEVDGGGAIGVTSQMGTAAIFERADGRATSTTVRGCYIHHYNGDGINLFGGGALVEQNRILLGGWNNTGAHSDLCQIVQAAGALSSTVQDNFFDFTPDPDPLGTMGRTSCLAISGCPNGVTARRNFFGWGCEVLDNGYIDTAPGPGYFTPTPRGIVWYSAVATNASIVVDNNVFNYDTDGGGPWYTTRKGVTSFASNYRYEDNALLVYAGNN